MAALDFDRSLAVVIGIDQYGHGIPALRTAVADAGAVAELLGEEHGYEVRLLLDGQATGQRLRKLVREVLPGLLTERSRLLFYFAGHGIAQDGDDGPAGYLIPQDARAGKVSSYFPMKQLHDQLTALPCRHFLAIFDCCFAGAFRWSSTRRISRVPAVIHRERFDRFQLDPAWQVITSASYDQEAWDVFHLQDSRGLSNQQHSPFALSLMQALKGAADSYPLAKPGQPPGDGVITATELYLYLRDQVEVLTEGQRRRQTPEICSLRNHDKGEFIFLTPGHALNLPPAPPLNRANNPYRGLESFEEEHAALFFGRGDRVKALHQYVLDHPLSVVLGPSGSGKSSLVKAGLLPQLRRQDHWQILGPFRPGTMPLQLLPRIIAAIVEPGAAHPATHDASQMTDLAEGALAKRVQAWAKAHPGQQLLLVIDQFEELLTLTEDEAAQNHLLKQLEQVLVTAPSVFRLVITLRADLEPQFQDRAFPVQWQSSRFILPPMNRADLREAIEQPASAKVMYFQSDDPRHPLVEQIIDEVADMPGALPLLSFTLSELYLKFLQRQQVAQQQGETLDRAILEADYKALGGVARSLTQRADQEYDALVKQAPVYAHSVRNVMLRMLALGSGEVTRRRVPLMELDYPDGEQERVQTVIRRYARARLLVEGQDLMGQAYVEPAHDALVRGWQRLLQWQRQEENLGLQRRLTPAAQDWQREQQSRFLWHRDPRLEVLRPVLQSSHSWLNRLETEFLQRSLDRKRLNKQLWTGGTIAIISLLTAGLLTALWGQRGRIIANSTTSRALARAALDQNHSLDSLLDSLAAARALEHPLVRLMGPQADLKSQVQGTLQWALLNVREQNRFQGHTGPVRSQWSPDGQVIASAGEDGWISLWRANGEELARWQADPQRLWHLSFSPDSQMIASAGEEGSLRLWDLTGQQLAQLTGHQGAVRYVSFSPDGQSVASGGAEDGQVLIWGLASSNERLATTPIARWSVGESMIKSLDFHPTAPIIATSDPRKIQLWNLEGKPIKVLDQHAWAVSFTPDGQQLLAAGDDGQVGLWEVASGKQLRQWQADNQRLWDLTLSPDGEQVATAGEDGIVKLWRRSGQAIAEFRNHTGPARSASFAPDGTQLLSSGDDSSTRIWRSRPPALAELGDRSQLKTIRWVNGGTQLLGNTPGEALRWWNPTEAIAQEQALPGPVLQAIDVSTTKNLLAGLQTDGKIVLAQLRPWQPSSSLKLQHPQAQHLALSPDGRWLATATGTIGSATPIRLWDIQQQEFRALPTAVTRLQQLRFSPDSQTLAIAGDQGRIEIRATASGKRLQLLQEHIGLVHAIAFNPVDPQRLASGGEDGTIRLWDVARGRSVGSPFQLYEQQVNTVSFSPDGLSLGTGDRSGSVQLWDLVQGEKQASWQGHEGEVRDLQFRPDGQQLATVGQGDGIKLWELDSFEQLIERGCAQAESFLRQQAVNLESDPCPSP